MFIENIKKRVKDYDNIKNYYNENKNACNTEMDSAVRAAVVSIATLSAHPASVARPAFKLWQARNISFGPQRAGSTSGLRRNS